MFRSLGYVECQDGWLEVGTEKIAIYGDEDGNDTHVARQLASGRWTSKLGGLEDIEHPQSDDLADSDYGRIVGFMRRARMSSWAREGGRNEVPFDVPNHGYVRR